MFDNLDININNKRHMYNENMDYYDINTHIEQGKQFKIYGKKYYSDNEHKLLEDSSSPEWGSIVEAMTSPDSVKKRNGNVEGMVSMASLSQNNAEFNNQLTSYSTLYNMYMSTMLQKPPTDEARIAMEAELARKKAALLAAASQLNADMINNSSSNDAIRATIAEKQNNLRSFIANHEIPVSKNQYDESTISGKIETTSLNMTSIYYHYLVYFIITVTLISFTFNMLVNPNANPMNAAYVLGALFIVYFITKRNAFE